MTWSPPMTKKDRANLMKHDRTESSVPCTQEMVSHDIASNRSTWQSWLQPGVQSIHHSGTRGGHLSALREGTSCSEGFVLNLWLCHFHLLFSCGCWFSNQFTLPVYIFGKKYWHEIIIIITKLINISWISKSIPEMCRLQVQSITCHHIHTMIEYSNVVLFLLALENWDGCHTIKTADQECSYMDMVRLVWQELQGLIAKVECLLHLSGRTWSLGNHGC